MLLAASEAHLLWSQSTRVGFVALLQVAGGFTLCCNIYIVPCPSSRSLLPWDRIDSISAAGCHDVEPTTCGCRDPIIAIAAVGGVALGGLALLDWHYALGYVGTVGILLTIVAWFTSYNSPQVKSKPGI